MRKIGKLLICMGILTGSAVALTGCRKAEDYKTAYTYFQEGRFEEALAIYESLDSYKDSEYLAEDCKNMIALKMDENEMTPVFVIGLGMQSGERVDGQVSLVAQWSDGYELEYIIYNDSDETITINGNYLLQIKVDEEYVDLPETNELDAEDEIEVESLVLAPGESADYYTTFSRHDRLDVGEYRLIIDEMYSLEFVMDGVWTE